MSIREVLRLDREWYQTFGEMLPLESVGTNVELVKECLEKKSTAPLVRKLNAPGPGGSRPVES